MAKVVLKGVRLAFANIFEPKQFNGQGEPACSASFLIDPKTQKGEMDKVIATIKKVAEEKWGAKAGETLKTLNAKGDVCLHDGATKAEYEGFDGMVYVSARNKARPVVVDRNGSPLTQGDGKPFSGCYVDVSLDIWAQANNYGKRINAKLLAVKYDKDGPAFSGGEGYSEGDFEFDDGDGGGEMATEGAESSDGFF